MGPTASGIGYRRESILVLRGNLCLGLLAAYILLRVILGALVNPLYNGPDESGHVEYVRSLAERGGLEGTGVESRQPPTYYLLASLIWRATTGQSESVQVFATRLLSAVAGMATLLVAWATANRVWPDRPRLALVVGSILLAPGHLYVLSSVNNEPLAVLFASIAVLATVCLWRHAQDALLDTSGPTTWPWRWYLVWLGASVAAVATKLSSLPVVLATLVILVAGLRHRSPTAWCTRRRAHTALAVAVVALPLLIAYLTLLRQHPSSSYLAAVAHVGPRAIIYGPLAYLSAGGLVESMRTFWYGYDYLVRWHIAAEAVLNASAWALTVLALGGLITGHVTHRQGASTLAWPGVLWIPVAVATVQVLAVISRFGLSDLLGNHMGGAAQAKAFFAAIVPSAIVVTAGLVSAGQRLGWRDSHLAAGTFSFVLTMDVAALAVMLWQHYRWLQIGV